jgi:hypothetical protein
MMKKIGILFIAVMLLSVGIISGCTQQNGNNNGNNTEPIITPKYNEFVHWSINTSAMIEIQLKLLGDRWDDENWSDCRSYISYVKIKIDTYTDQALFFDLQGSLDSARNEFIHWLNAYLQVYDKWELAVQYFIAGDNATGNSYAQEGQTLLENTKIYADNYNRYITEWRNEG